MLFCQNILYANYSSKSTRTNCNPYTSKTRMMDWLTDKSHTKKKNRNVKELSKRTNKIGLKMAE